MSNSNRFVCSFIGAVLILLWGIACFGQQPEQPITAIDYSLYAGVLATRTLDFVSTEQLLDRGGHELILPSGLVSDRPAFAAFSLGSGVAEIYASRKLRRNHPKLARGILFADILAAAIVAGHNEAILPRRVK
jgi:hypothetical protein